MTWLARLYETYEQASLKEHQIPLLPISHTLQNAHIKVVIDGDGNFLSAEVLQKTQIILAATESSAGRSSGCAPHALSDKLQYVAKDYPMLGGEKKSYFAEYEKQLNLWCESEYSHPKAKAILKYVQKNQMISDLVKVGVLYIDEKGALLKAWQDETDVPPIFKVLPKKKNSNTKVNEIEPGDALVAWEVQIFNDNEAAEIWRDKSLQQAWINYDASQATKRGYCVISQQDQALATNHPAKLRNTGDKAKLISSNDSSGFTFRGRFLEPDEAFTVSFELTQKAHNALRWLISRQGYRNGDQYIIAWATSGVKVRPPVENFWQIEVDAIEEDLDFNASSLKKNDDKIDHAENFGQIFAGKLKKRLAGYRASVADDEQIILLILDSATPGRMAIVYYQELNKQDYFGAIDAWENDFLWYQRVSLVNEQAFMLKAPPAPWLIAKVAYGDSVDDKLKKQTTERLFPCIVERKQISKDMVDSCIRAASNPLAYKSDERWRWKRNIGVACAVYKGWRARLKNEDRRGYDMSLEREYTGRDYLYGRLLALAEKIEAKALLNAKENRVTNAERLMQHFSMKPFKTWEILRKSIQPYINRLKISSDAGLLNYWEKEIGEVSNLFQRNDFSSNKKLSGEFLLGYYCQKNFKKDEDKANQIVNQGVEHESE
jgi:CRISPR-associated protein Csd1